MDLDQFSKSDLRKIQIARRLPQETTMPLRWIADRLQNGERALCRKIDSKDKSAPPLSTPFLSLSGTHVESFTAPHQKRNFALSLAFGRLWSYAFCSRLLIVVTRRITMAALVIVPGIIFLCTGFWLFASRSRVLPDPAYSRQQNSVVALFTLPPSALRGFSVFGLQHDWEISTWSSNGWERAQQFGIEGGWENNEYTLLARVPPAKWKIELRVGLQREVRVGRRRLASFWTSNVWTSAELPPLSEIEGKVK